MAKKEIKRKYLVYFEGNIDEITLVYFIRKISESKEIPVRMRSSLKFVLIEMITNMISHSVGDSYGIISVQEEKGKYKILTRNYTNETNFKSILSNIDTIKKIKNVKNFYNEQLKSVSYDKSVNLGLIEIYNRCKGNLKVESGNEGKKFLITFNVLLDDSN